MNEAIEVMTKFKDETRAMGADLFVHSRSYQMSFEYMKENDFDQAGDLCKRAVEYIPFEIGEVSGCSKCLTISIFFNKG